VFSIISEMHAMSRRFDFTDNPIFSVFPYSGIFDQSPALTRLIIRSDQVSLMQTLNFNHKDLDNQLQSINYQPSISPIAIIPQLA
jgi:hypothetical protein